MYSQSLFDFCIPRDDLRLNDHDPPFSDNWDVPQYRLLLVASESTLEEYPNPRSYAVVQDP